MAKQKIRTYTNDFALEHNNGGAYTDREVDKWCEKQAKKFGIKFNILTYHGCGGGSPCIQVKGEEEALKKFLAKEYYGGCKIEELTQRAGVDSINELWD